MLCENCHQREANCHLHTVKDGIVTSRDLCSECYDASSPEAMKLAEAQLDLHCQYCQYCGAPAATGWAAGIWSAEGTGSEEAHFRCEQCEEDLKEFESKPENRLPKLPADFDYDDPIASQALQRLMDAIREREQAFMRQKLAQRKGPGR